MAIPKIVKKVAIKKAVKYLDKDPVANIPKLLELADMFDHQNAYLQPRNGVRNIIQNPENIWYKLICSLWTDIDKGVRSSFFENFFVNATFAGWDKQNQNREKYGCNVPWAILMDPTSACNLHCTGCWAAEYGSKLNMSYDQLNEIIRQGKDLGVYFYIYSGGEPLVRKKDIIKLCEEHQDCTFLSFTNGTLIDEAFADDMLRVKNFIPAISVEGFEEATDSRRGAGTFAALRRGMELLKERKLLFGVSCCYTSANTDVIGSEGYFDSLIDWGAKFVWLFTYIPVGVNAVPELLASPEQREFMYHQVRAFRKTKPIFTMDFWNDGEFSDGCIAGGRRYLHINANGDIEPCAFIHYSDSNIKENTILEALQSPLFMAYHDSQPFNDNMLRPCPALDNPGALTKMVESSCAFSTDFVNPETAKHFSDKCEDAALAWAPVADRLWTCSGKCSRKKPEDYEGEAVS